MANLVLGIELRPDGPVGLLLAPGPRIVREVEPSDSDLANTPSWIGLPSPSVTWAIERVPFSGSRQVRRAASTLIEPHMPGGEVDLCLADGEILSAGQSETVAFVASAGRNLIEELSAQYGSVGGVSSTALEIGQAIGANGQLAIHIVDGCATIARNQLIREVFVGHDPAALTDEIRRSIDLAEIPPDAPVVIYSEQPIETPGLTTTARSAVRIDGVDVPARLLGAYCAGRRGLGLREEGLNLLRAKQSQKRQLFRKIAAPLAITFLSAAALLVSLGISLKLDADRLAEKRQKLAIAEHAAWQTLFPGQDHQPGRLGSRASEQAQQYVPDSEAISALKTLAEISRLLPDVNKTGLTIQKLSLTSEGFVLTGSTSQGKAIATEHASLIEGMLDRSTLFRAKATEVRVKDDSVELRVQGTFR